MTDASDILELATKRAEDAKSVWAEVYQAAKDDLHFLSDEPYAQWDEKEAQNRVSIGRPALQIDQLSQFIHQVSNDIRMNTPTINVIPAHMDSDAETAEIIQGRIKAIEYKSNADSAYDMAADFAVKSSLGFIRVDRDYVDDESFDQALKICRVTNPLAVLIDPGSVQPDGSDAEYAFVFDEITRKEFEKKWPDANPVSFGDDSPSKEIKPDDMIVIAEYFYFDDKEEEYGLLENGERELVKKGGKYKTKRKVSKRVVKHCKLAADDILEETTFPGKYIPIIPVYGEEAWMEGKRKIYSLIRKSKSAQQMYNLWKSLETELLLKQQQAPVQAAVGQMRGFEDDWKTPEKAMVLYYSQTDVDGNPAPAPQRLQPPTIPTGIVNAARETVDDIKATMGLYNASIGNRSNETSGIAIQRRQQEGDVATFHFGDNLVRSITQVGKIIVSALAEVEDSPRVVQTIGAEDETKQVGINGAMVEGQERTYDFTKGKWDVRVVTGSSFTTQRQEAAALYTEVVTKMPDLMPVIGDLVFKYQDAPGAQAISARLKKLVDPKLLNEQDREDGAPDPQIMEMQAKMQEFAQQAQAQMQQLQAELDNKQGEMMIKQEEVGVKKSEVAIKAGDLKLKYLEALKPESAPTLDARPQGTPTPAIPLDAPIEVFQAALEQRISEQRNSAEQAKQMAIQEQLAAESLSLKEQQDREFEMMELQQRQEQAIAIANALGGISQQLGQLTAQVSQPIKVVRDEAGNLLGAE